jgi:hypothetical protein
MITSVTYKGPFIPEAPFDGERSSDGMTPNYAQGLQVSRDRWLILYDTVDSKGRDCWRSIFYQLRADGPDGDVIMNGQLFGMESITTLSDGTDVLRSNGQPGIFGVPEGAVIDGQTPAHANVFAVSWYGCVVGRKDGDLARINAHPELTADELKPYHELMHVRLNDAEDDIEIISERQRLETPDGGHLYGHGWAQPVADNADATRWIDSFSGRGAAKDDLVFGSCVGIIAYEWNAESERYALVRVGDFFPVKEGLTVSETNLVKVGDGHYVLGVRSFNEGGHTYWYRADDPFGDWGEYTVTPDTFGQRYAFLCGDGVLRSILNRRDLSPYDQRRNPLYCFDVNPVDRTYSNQRVLMDAKELGLPFEEAFLDHVHLYAPVNGKQIMSVRTITAKQVWRSDDGEYPSDEEMKLAGIHHLELEYDEPCEATWTFE